MAMSSPTVSVAALDLPVPLRGAPFYREAVEQ